MESIIFEDSSLPVYHRAESIGEHTTHSELSHFHDDLEIIVVDKGTILCQTGGTTFELLSGDICFINRKQLHRIEMTDEPESHKVLIIGTKLLMQNPQIYEKFFRPMLEDPRFSHVRFGGDDSCAAHIRDEVAAIEQRMREQDCCYELDVLSSVFRLGKYLYTAYRQGESAASLDSNALIQQKMTEFIYTHAAESLTLEDIAQSAHVSKSQASKLFRRYTGLSPIAYLNRHRLALSQALLRSTTQPIADVAQQCGFSDQSYFNRLFLREYGTTPLSYRKRVD